METSIRQNSGWLPPDLRCITLAPGNAGEWRVTCEYESESMVATEFVFESGYDPRAWLAYLLMSALRFDTETATCVAAGLFAGHFFARRSASGQPPSERDGGATPSQADAG